MKIIHGYYQTRSLEENNNREKLLMFESQVKLSLKDKRMKLMLPLSAHLYKAGWAP